MTTEEPDEKFHWHVVFRQGGKTYTYQYRTVEYMIGEIDRRTAEHGVPPFSIFAYSMDGTMRPVNPEF